MRRTLLLLLALLAPACKRGPDEAALAAAAANARHGVYADRVSGIDPLHIGSAAAAIGVNVFETLYQYHYLRRPYALVPLLAAAMPTVSPDGLVYTIPIRRDAAFAPDPAFAGGGPRPLVADDFAFAIQRIADARNASPHWGAWRDRVVGLDAWRAASMRPGFDPATPVAGLTAIDPHTLRVTLTRPWPQLTHVLATLPTAAVAREVVAAHGDEIGLHPVGTGPYRLARWRPDVEIVLERVPGWRGDPYPSDGEPGDREAGLLADAGRPMPFIDALVFRHVTGQANWLLFMKGALDYNGTPGDQFEQVFGADRRLDPAMKARGIEAYVFEASFARWIGLNMANPLIAGNPHLRRAISHALDRQEFNEVFVTGRNDLPQGIIPPALRPRRPGPPHPNVTFDLDRARRELALAVARNGGPIPPLRLLFGGQGGVQRQVGQLLVRNLAAAGLTLVVDYVDEGSPYRRIAAERGAHLIFGVGYSPSYPDAIDLFKRFHSAGIETEVNVFGYDNPVYDALYERAAIMPDSPARQALYDQMEAILLDALPAIPYLEYNHFFVKHDWLRNAKPHAFYGPSGMAKYHRIDTARRVEAIRARR